MTTTHDNELTNPTPAAGVEIIETTRRRCNPKRGQFRVVVTDSAALFAYRASRVAATPDRRSRTAANCCQIVAELLGLSRFIVKVHRSAEGTLPVELWSVSPTGFRRMGLSGHGLDDGVRLACRGCGEHVATHLTTDGPLCLGCQTID